MEDKIDIKITVKDEHQDDIKEERYAGIKEECYTDIKEECYAGIKEETYAGMFIIAMNDILSNNQEHISLDENVDVKVSMKEEVENNIRMKPCANDVGHAPVVAIEPASSRCISCPICCAEFSTTDNLQEHFFVHGSIKIFKCKRCDELFHRNTNLKVMYTSTSHFECSMKGNHSQHGRVDSASLRKKSVDTGKRRKPGNGKKCMCKYCGKAFRYNSLLIAHIRYHTDERPFSCDICDKSFTQKSHLVAHLRNIHSDDDKSFECTECNQVFDRKHSLTRHFRSHTVERQSFSCSTCSKSYRYKSLLAIHMQVHSGERPFRCTECSKDFSGKSRLTRHFKRLHAGYKPNKCQYCHHVFTWKYQLAKHLEETHSKHYLLPP